MPMNCPYCRTVNDEEHSRCARCGRRLRKDSPTPSNEVFPSVGGTALAAQRSADPAALASDQPAVTAPDMTAEDPARQPGLFREVSAPASPGPKVVPIPTLSPLRPASPLDRDGVRRAAARSSRPHRPNPEQQQTLELVEEAAVSGRPEEVLYCDARVALPTHRMLASVVDGLCVALGTAIFLGVAWAGGVDLSQAGSLVAVAAASVVLVLYRGLYCLLNRDTPGLRFAGLRLVDFDGRPPRQKLRVARQFAGLMSLASAGVGLVWALVDEESLTWHDHISKTFPTAV